MNILTAPLRETSTKREILLLLKRYGSITIQEMAEHLGLTGMAIRRHVQALQKDRYIQISLLRQHVGRPKYVYYLTVLAEQLFPTQYDALSLDFIDEIHVCFGDAAVDTLFLRRAEKLERQYRSRISGRGLEQRAEQLAVIQNEAGYMVKLDKVDEGTFVLEESHCPIYQVASRYQQACRCELAMFSSLLDAHVERKECMAQGGTRCSYSIREKRSDEAVRGGTQ